MLDLRSGDASRALNAFAKLVVTHNFKGLDGKPCEDVLDAPLEALTQTLRVDEGEQPDPDQASPPGGWQSVNQSYYPPEIIFHVLVRSFEEYRQMAVTCLIRCCCLDDTRGVQPKGNKMPAGVAIEVQFDKNYDQLRLGLLHILISRSSV